MTQPITAIQVDLGKAPEMPATVYSGWVKEHRGTGMATLECRGGDLYLGGRKVILYQPERQRSGKFVRGSELREEIVAREVLNANVHAALFTHPQLIPEDWKVDEQGRTRIIDFWGTTYRLDASDETERTICDLYFLNGRWQRYYEGLIQQWTTQRWAAVLEG